jgi:hypothetical protein
LESHRIVLFSPKVTINLESFIIKNVHVINEKVIKRLIRFFGVSLFILGPQGDQFQLADNMWGKNSLPQIKVIPICDLGKIKNI